MGKFVLGLLIGLLLGLIFSEQFFPDGFSVAVQHWGDHLRTRMPAGH